MTRICLSTVPILLALSIISLPSAQAADPQTCRQTVQTNCTKCHGANKICAKLDAAGADWKKIVATMGQRGKLPQDVQDAAVTCLTSPEAKKAACDK